MINLTKIINILLLITLISCSTPTVTETQPSLNTVIEAIKKLTIPAM